jgi:hypothetical protein
MVIADSGLLILRDCSSHEFSNFFALARIELKLGAGLLTILSYSTGIFSPNSFN